MKFRMKFSPDHEKTLNEKRKPILIDWDHETHIFQPRYQVSTIYTVTYGAKLPSMENTEATSDKTKSTSDDIKEQTDQNVIANFLDSLSPLPSHDN